MGYKTVILVLAFASSCLAAPKFNEDTDISQFLIGTSDPETRISGGTAAAEGSLPYMVALTTGTLITSFLCGGSLITTKHVMTAAHCTDAAYSWGSLSSSLRGIVGTNEWKRGGTKFRFSRNITHPHYLKNDIKNDISILVINGNLALTDKVAPIALDFNYVGEGVEARVAGWGRIRFGGSLSNIILELQTKSVDGEECKKLIAQGAVDFNIKSPGVEPHIEVCTYHSDDFGTCHGDSGSALVRVDRNAQIGIVSWGFPCARGVPDMYARISAYRDWILSSVDV